MKKLTRLVFPILLLIIGVQVTRDYFGSSTGEAKEKYETLISSGQTTVAQLNSEYKETTIKVAKIPIKTYEVYYTFSVNGKQYNGTKKLRSPPIDRTMQVVYLPSNPVINSINPKEELKKINEMEGEISTLMIGAGVILLGLFLLYNRLKKMKKTKSISSTIEKKKFNFMQKKEASPKKEKKTLIEALTIDEKNQKIKDLGLKMKTQSEGYKPNTALSISKTFVEELKKDRDVKRKYTKSDHTQYMPKPLKNSSDENKEV